MTLTTAFKTLERQLHTLREDLIGLRTNIIEDKPVGEEVVFVSGWATLLIIYWVGWRRYFWQRGRDSRPSSQDPT